MKLLVSILVIIKLPKVDNKIIIMGEVVQLRLYMQRKAGAVQF